MKETDLAPEILAAVPFEPADSLDRGQFTASSRLKNGRFKFRGFVRLTQYFNENLLTWGGVARAGLSLSQAIFFLQ